LPLTQTGEHLLMLYALMLLVEDLPTFRNTPNIPDVSRQRFQTLLNLRRRGGGLHREEGE